MKDKLKSVETAELKRILRSIDENQKREAEERFSSLEKGLRELVDERREQAKAHPLKISANASSAPIISVVVEGTLFTSEEAERVIDECAMEKVRKNTDFYSEKNQNNFKLVLDLRGLRDVYFEGVCTVLYRWAPYINFRASNGGAVVLVLPRESPVLGQLQAAAEATDLKKMLQDVPSVKVVHRARDVAAALG